MADEVCTSVSSAEESYRVRLRFHPTAARAARTCLTDFLTDRRIAEGVIDDVRLVASELVANAVQHGRPSSDGFLGLGWVFRAAEIVLEVEDCGDQPVHLRPITEGDVGGRGLRIVDSLARGWTVHRDAGTTLVCARIALHA